MPTRLNHMEITLPMGGLAEPARGEIKNFYGNVFGWEALDVKILGERDLLLAIDPDVSQFILLAESNLSLSSPGYDHLGLLQDTRSQVDELLEKCEKYRAQDSRVKIKYYDDLVQGNLTVHAFYVKYLLPIYFDVQVLEWKKGSEPQRRWSYS